MIIESVINYFISIIFVSIIVYILLLYRDGWGNEGYYERMWRDIFEKYFFMVKLKIVEMEKKIFQELFWWIKYL